MGLQCVCTYICASESFPRRPSLRRRGHMYIPHILRAGSITARVLMIPGSLDSLVWVSPGT